MQKENDCKETENGCLNYGQKEDVEQNKASEKGLSITQTNASKDYFKEQNEQKENKKDKVQTAKTQNRLLNYDSKLKSSYTFITCKPIFTICSLYRSSMDFKYYYYFYFNIKLSL